MNRIKTYSLILLLVMSVTAITAVADAPATQPSPPALLTKLATMPANIWMSHDAGSTSKYGWAPERLKWLMGQFPMSKGSISYGEDSFTGRVIFMSSPNPDHKTRYYKTEIQTDIYDVCGVRVQFTVAILSTTPQDYTKGEVVTVNGPAQFWQHGDFALPQNRASGIQFMGVVINPELCNSPYPAPILLKQMGQ